MKNFKKQIAILLTIIMMFTVVPINIVNAKDTTVTKVGSTYSGTCGDSTYWSLDTNTGVLNITGTGSITSYSSGSSPWYSYISSIETISIASGITSIGFGTFRDCKSLTNVTIPSGVTSIGNYAFSDCTSLTSIIIPNSVKSIGEYIFYSCRKLTNITMSDNLTSISKHAFYDCTSLKSISIPTSVTNIGEYAFSDCTSITNITIPSSVKSIGAYAFRSCTSLTSVTIPSSVTYIAGAPFSCCTSLTNIVVNGSNTNYSSLNGNLYNKDKTELLQYAVGKSDSSFTMPSSVTSIGKSAFDGCISLTNVSIPSSVTSIGNAAFDDCTSLTSIIIPSSVTSIGTYTFNGCSNLTDVYYTGTESQWDSMTIGAYNTSLTNATKHYLGTTEPTEPTTATVAEVIKKSQTITGVKKSYTKTYGSSGFYLYPNAKTNVTYKSSNTKVATVSKYGMVALKGIGTAKITINATGNTYYKPATKTITIKSKLGKISKISVKKIKILKIKSEFGLKVKVSWTKPKGTKYVNYVLYFPNGKVRKCIKSSELSRCMNLKNNKNYFQFTVTAVAKNGSKSSRTVKFKIVNNKIKNIKLL